MKHRLYSLILAALFGMAGAQVWAQELTTTEIDGVTYYEIGSAADLLAFADLVNAGEFGANAILTADIDLTGATASGTWEIPIGAFNGSDDGAMGSSPFTGIFDGQGHKITGFDAESAGHGGLFGDVSGATIKNFSISGTLTATEGHGTGVVGFSAGSNISNIHSALDIDVPVASVCHVGGVVGSARGNNTISNCTFSGNLNVAAGSNDCFGGVVGYIGADRVLYCANYGKLDYEATNCYAGGIVGYLNNSEAIIKGCLNMGPVTFVALDETPTYGGAIVGRLRSSITKLTDNCWLEGSATGACRNDSGVDVLTQAFCFTTDILLTGEVCYKLNGDQTTISWYQTLGTDEQPTLDATHAQVYMAGHKHCDGTLYEGYSFSNEPSEISQDDHNIVNGVCDYCGFFDEEIIANSMILNDEGFYEIGNAPQFFWFAKYVNSGHADANAILTADIDFGKAINESRTWTPVGTDSYKGTFDGKGFTISNFNVTTNGDHYGLFGKLGSGAVVKNFTIYGTLNSLNQYVGVIGSAGGGTINISDIHSYLNITCSKSRHAGVLGFQSSTGTINIDRCIYSGTLDAGNTTGNLGGIMGLTQNSTSAYVNITDCLFDGTILDGTGSNAGGILGYANKTKVTIKNCLSVGTVISTNPSPFIGQLNASNSKWAGKNYYTTEGNPVGLPGSGVTVSGPEPEETEESPLASGEICWMLNEEDFLDAAWRQTILEEPYPLPTSKGDYVYLFSTGYDNINSENISELISKLSADEIEFVEDEDLIAYKELIDAYKAEIESWESITDIDEFLEAYRAAADLKESIEKSVASYAAYVKVCEETLAYVDENGLDGDWVDFLKTYLDEQDVIEPNASYPNGNYAYIMENLNLDDEALVEEIEFVNQMLANAVAGGITAGTEITRMLSNSDFADGFEGWTVESDEGITMSYGGTKDVMPIARGGGKGTFDVSQSLAELPNGIYVMAANGLFRGAGDIYNRFYAGQLYLNGTVNYFMSPGEDVIKEEDAEPGVNCLGENGDTEYVDDVIGWIPNNMNCCSYAFNGGRYQNFTATEITDGNLTVGVRSLGTGLDSDWMPFANLHIWYMGTAEEADAKLKEVLDGYVDRAKTIVDFEFDVFDDFQKKPNMSNSLKDQLSTAIDAVEDATTGEMKLKLINTFSELFNEVLACRKAYIGMLAAANKLYEEVDALYNIGLITDIELNKWEGLIYAAQGHFEEGTASTEEALAIAEELKSANLIPVPVSEEGVYQLATAEHLRIFSVLVNNSNPAAKAVLTADIDMSELGEDDPFEPIGRCIQKDNGTFYSDNAFQGVFDGQGYAIKNFVYNASGLGNGLFGLIYDATVKNFRISGTLTSDGYNYNGVIGAAEGSSKVSGIYSDMAVNVSNFKAHSGGIVGGCSTSSKVLVENCEYAGTLTHSGAGDCQAGILGYTYAGGVKNCVFSGTIIGENSKYGGILGYCKIPGFQGVQNCLSVGKIIASENCTTAAAIIANWNGDKTSTVKNNYYCMKEGTSGNVVAIGNKSANCEAPVRVTPEQLESGEICFKLNGEQPSTAWYQTICEDAYPVPFDTHAVVLFSDEYGYYNDTAEGPVGIKDVKDVTDTKDTKDIIFNLAGQRLQKLQKGINIVNGKKILVK